MPGGGLLWNSFVRPIHVDTGFRADHALALELSFSEVRYPDREPPDVDAHATRGRRRAPTGLEESAE